MTSATFDPTLYLPDDLLERIRSRAAQVDADNVFPEQDLAELREAGYLRILVPTDRGGFGLGLEQAAVLQQRLASAAPATALSINMHLVWTGVAKVPGSGTWTTVPGSALAPDYGLANGTVTEDAAPAGSGPAPLRARPSARGRVGCRSPCPG